MSGSCRIPLVATPLVNYGVAYGRGVAFGIGLQAIEASVGVGWASLFLAREEGVSYATPQTASRSPDQPPPRESHRSSSRSPNVLALASPASLKGVLTPLEAATLPGQRDAPGRGCPTSTEAPVADGGEGTAAVLESALGGEWRTAVVQGPLGAPVAASWLVLPDGTAVVESSAGGRAAVALTLQRDPLRATSHGVGDLLVAAVADGAASLLVGVGGTATVDDGRDQGCANAWGGDSTASSFALRAMCGTRCSARAAPPCSSFGPAEGPGPDAVVELERRLAAMTELAPYADLPGAGGRW